MNAAPIAAPVGVRRDEAADGTAVSRSWLWPRRPAFSWALTIGLAAACGISLLPAAGRFEPRVVAVALFLATVGRLVVCLPVARRSASPAHEARLRVVFAASSVALLGWLTNEALGWAHYPLALAGRWAGAALLLMAAAPLRRVELACGIGGRLFFVGSIEQLADLLVEVAQRPPFDILGHLDPDQMPSVETIADVVLSSGATALILSDEAIRSPLVVEAATRINLRGVRVRDLRGFYEQEFDKVAISDLSLSWFLFDIAAIHKRRAYGLVKRALETTVALIVLLICGPLLPLIALAVKLSSPGPVLFRQRRVGRDGEIFTLRKFRTMHTAGGREHGQWAGQSADRLFLVGRVLRRLRLDELPQLVAIVRGDLSLVGPRPEQPEIADRLASTMRYYHARHTVRPGLTGWAQVNLGYSGSEEGALAKLQYDLFYIKRQSLGLDMRIMASTARAVLFGSGS